MFKPLQMSNQKRGRLGRFLPYVFLARVLSQHSFATGTWFAVGGTGDCTFDLRVLENVFWSRRTQNGTQSVRRGCSGVVEPLCK
ncbi:hypothetical protein EDD17DRAFT_1574375 [Pisolithus thermaeus]|nr:hypothetical protein EDD17DRAFT_1574375 [Pisolithus thermaeus]